MADQGYMGFSGVNYVAIIAAAAASWLVGAAWYMTLAKPSTAARGWASKDEMVAEQGRPSPAPFIISFVAELVMAGTLAGIIGHAAPVTVATA